MLISFSRTSSNGNCSVIESSDGHLLIIDAGIKYCQVDKEVGYRLHKADALLVTHTHNDHTKYLNEFLDIRNIFIPYEYTKNFQNQNNLNRFHFQLYNSDRVITDSFIFIPLEMIHTNSDGTKCECYGFVIGDKSTKEKLLWATDTQYIEHCFPPLEYYCIESNYFETDYNCDDLDYITKSVEQRRLQSHMSFESAVKFLKMQDLSKCKEIRLLHVSSFLKDKDKQKMKRKLRSELKDQIKGKDIKIYA